MLFWFLFIAGGQWSRQKSLNFFLGLKSDKNNALLQKRIMYVQNKF